MAFFCISCKSPIEMKFKACPFCGEPITDFLRRYLESPIDGKYQIISRLGVGGMGEVYKVLHVHLNSIRVIKLMRTNISKQEGAHERFVREARLATRIQSPYVAALYDFSTMEDGTYYMVWEYIEGTNLMDLIRARGALSPQYAARLAIQGLLGLDAIHRAGVVHRDISPENLMITEDEEGEERVKIIDLGIAKQWDDTLDAKTKTGIFVGKWKYCSPEHLGMLKEGERIDGRADLYSFGIVLYEMLAGVAPFIADTPHRYLLMHAAESPRPINQVNRGARVPPEMEGLIFRSLEKDRANRFATAREFARALEVLLPALEDVAAPAPAVEHEDAPTEERATIDSRSLQEMLAATQAVTLRRDEEKIETVAGANLAGVRDESLIETVAEPVPRDAGMERQIIRSPEIASVAIAPTVIEKKPSGRGRLWGGLAAAVVAAVVAAFVLSSGILSKRASPAPAPVHQTASSPGAGVNLGPSANQSSEPEVAVGINAFPWGEVTAIRNVKTGEVVTSASKQVTPLTLQLKPGTYEIELSNPQFGQSKKTFDVAAGTSPVVMVQFADGAALPLPSFSGAAD